MLVVTRALITIRQVFIIILNINITMIRSLFHILKNQLITADI